MRNRICQRSKEAKAKTKEAETSSTNVETIRLEEVHSTADVFVENDKQNEDRKNTEQSDESKGAPTSVERNFRLKGKCKS